MDSDDILLWQDGFWCFREEFHRRLLRNNYYRTIRYNSDEGQKLIAARRQARRAGSATEPTAHSTGLTAAGAP